MQRGGLKRTKRKEDQSIHTKPYIRLNVHCSPARAVLTETWAVPLTPSLSDLSLCRCQRGGSDQRDVSRLCRGLLGAEGVADLVPSGRRWLLLSTALLFWLGERDSGVVGAAVTGEGVGEGGVGVVLRGLAELRLVGASSSASVSSMRGMWGSESSIRNSGWVMKLWMDVRDSGFSSPS